MIGKRTGLGEVVTADPGAVGPVQKEPRPPKRKRKVPKNIKGLKRRKKKG